MSELWQVLGFPSRSAMIMRNMWARLKVDSRNGDPLSAYAGEIADDIEYTEEYCVVVYRFCPRLTWDDWRFEVPR